MLKKSATEFRSDLGQNTLCAIMALKYNADDCCYTDVIMDKELLKRGKSASYLYNNYGTQVFCKRQVTYLLISK